MKLHMTIMVDLAPHHHEGSSTLETSGDEDGEKGDLNGEGGQQPDQKKLRPDQKKSTTTKKNT